MTTSNSSWPWPLRPVELLPAIGAEILEYPAPGLDPRRIVLLYDEDCDLRLRDAAAILYYSGLLVDAWALGESKGVLSIAPRQDAPWPQGLQVAGDYWSTNLVDLSDERGRLLGRSNGVFVEAGFCMKRIPDSWPSRDVLAPMLKQVYRV